MLDRFSRTVRMSPYLVAVAVTDYTSLPAPDNSTVVWAPREDIAAGRGNFANSFGAKIMRKVYLCLRSRPVDPDVVRVSE